MNAGLPAALFFCLGTGAALGLLFLLFRCIRILLRAGKVLTALLDFLFCLLCALTVFLCALAMDHGRLRLFQALFQCLGAWSVIAALDPFVSGALGAVSRFFHFLASHFERKRPKRRKKREKAGKTGKKQQKKT